LFPIENLLPITPLRIEAVHIVEETLTIQAASTAAAATCPLCTVPSTRIHSRYTRTVADLAWADRPLALHLQVRRFVCGTATCQRKIFAERFGAALPAFARRTTRLVSTLRTLAFSVGGQGGARLAHALKMPASPRTLLRLLHATPIPPTPSPHALGIDDWAWKKGRNYGTICVDLDRRQPIDLLPDRSPDSVTAWLQAQPQLTVVARDRGTGYIDAATRGAPQAMQVADRFHLLQNLAEALEACFGHHSAVLKQAAAVLNVNLNVDPLPHATARRTVPTLDGTTRNPREEAAGQRRHARALELYERVHTLAAKQVDVANIARQVGVSRQTVYRYLRRTTPPERTRIHVGRRHVIEPYKPYIVERWNDGCRNARQIWRELQDQGYPHAPRTVARFVAELRKDTGSGRRFRAQPAKAIYGVEGERKHPLTARQAAHLLLRRAAKRNAWQAESYAALCILDAGIADTDRLVQQFTEMVRCRQGEALDYWLAQVEARGVAELRSFATGLRKDYAAVKAGLTLPYSNGQTEAQIQRLKLLKRQMYGQAGFEVLRKRVLYREPPLPVRHRQPHVERRLAA
jgi:transposase